jgi:hypothetical protein
MPALTRRRTPGLVRPCPRHSLTVGSTGRTGGYMRSYIAIAATLILALIGLAAFVTNRTLKWRD